jgi:hypothetical protein
MNIDTLRRQTSLISTSTTWVISRASNLTLMGDRNDWASKWCGALLPRSRLASASCARSSTLSFPTPKRWAGSKVSRLEEELAADAEADLSGSLELPKWTHDLGSLEPLKVPDDLQRLMGHINVARKKTAEEGFGVMGVMIRWLVVWLGDRESVVRAVPSARACPSVR